MKLQNYDPKIKLQNYDPKIKLQSFPYKHTSSESK